MKIKKILKMLDFRLFESSENLGQVQAQRPYKFYSYIKKHSVQISS